MLCKRNSQFHLYNRFINLLSVSRDCSVIIVLSLSRNLSHFSPIWNNRSSRRRSSSRNLKNRGDSSTAYRSANKSFSSMSHFYLASDGQWDLDKTHGYRREWLKVSVLDRRVCYIFYVELAKSSKKRTKGGRQLDCKAVYN